MSGETFEGKVIVQAGTLDGREGENGEMGLGDVELEAELYVQDRVGWLEEIEGVGQFRDLLHYELRFNSVTLELYC